MTFTTSGKVQGEDGVLQGGECLEPEGTGKHSCSGLDNPEDFLVQTLETIKI